MSLISIKNLNIAFGGPAILADCEMQINEGEKIAILGRNGEGKSTLLKLICGVLKPDSGSIAVRKGLVIGYMPQEFPQIDGSIFDIVADGNGEKSNILKRYYKLSNNSYYLTNDDLTNEFYQLQEIMDQKGYWDFDNEVEKVLSSLSLDKDMNFLSLSEGLKRKTLFAKTIVAKPDVILLDEPTNHMDLLAIKDMENYLFGFKGVIVFISHDRIFLKKIATKIIEIDRGKLRTWGSDYSRYLQNKEEFLNAEEIQNAKFDKKLSEEESWIRRGIKARRTRNEGRVRGLIKLRSERSQRRETVGNIKAEVQSFSTSGKNVINAKNVSFSYDTNPIVKNFSISISRGDKIGIIGKNGCGKTTLIKLLLQEIQPQSGNVKLGTNIICSYFDQMKQQLDLEKTVAENIADNRDFVKINGRDKHVITYLQDFLFSKERINSKVKILSGGEKNRLLLAKLFTVEANLLILDEPTNDLDIETIEILEDLLVNYTGTLLFISHDREFVDNIATSLLVFKENGLVEEKVGGYKEEYVVIQKPKQKPKLQVNVNVKPKEKVRKKDLTYKEKIELGNIEADIEVFEEKHKLFLTKMSSENFYKQNKDDILKTKEEFDFMEQKLEMLYERWEELESLK